MKRYVVLLLLFLPLLIPVASQGYEITVPVTIYNNSDHAVYNGTFHIVFTPKNLTLPINLDTLYVTLDNGYPLYYTYNLPDLDAKQYYAVQPGLVLNGTTIKYTTSQPASDWYTTSYDDSSWISGQTPFGNYTNTTAYYIYSQIFDQGYYTLNNPRTELNITTLWTRFTAPPIPSGYTLKRALLGIVYLGSNFTAYVNGKQVGNYSTIIKASTNIYLYNASLYNDIAILDITNYINTTTNNLIAVFVNETGLPYYVARVFDVWVVYEVVPDYSKYLSIWVKVPYIPPHSYKVVVVHYGLYNLHPYYHDTGKVFLLYDSFSTKNPNWLWSSATDYEVTNDLLVHTYADGRSGILWYPINLDSYNTIYVKTLAFSTETVSFGDISLLITNETSPKIDFINATEAYITTLLGGGIVRIDTYNYTTGYVQGVGLPVYVAPEITAVFTNESASIITVDNFTNVTYTVYAPVGHYLDRVVYFGLCVKGYGAFEYVAVYQSTSKFNVTVGTPPNYIPPSQGFEGNYVNIYVANNGNVYLVLNNMRVYKYNTTVLRIGFINNSFIRIVYVGQYINSPEELRAFRITVLGDNTTQLANLTFTPFSTENHLVIEYADINITGYQYINIYIYDYNTGELLQIVQIKPPGSTPMTGYLVYIAYLVPLALLIAFVLRGNIKMVSIGFILYGIVVIMLPYLGLNVPYSMAISGLAIMFGIVLLFATR